MSNPRSDFSLAQLSEGVTTDPYVIKKAISNLKRFDSEGKLPPLPGWEGTALEGFMDILGLNGRPVRVNHGPGMKR